MYAVEVKPGVNLFKEIKQNGRPLKAKESKENQVLNNLTRFSTEDRELMFEMLVIRSLLAFTRTGRRGEGDQGEGKGTIEESYRECRCKREDCCSENCRRAKPG